MNADGAVVRFEHVSYETGGKRILEDATMEAMPGETLVLLGRSGAGKTTALKAVNRLVVPTSGKVEVLGRATTDWDPTTLRRRIGYVIQEIGLFPHFTVARNVGVVPRLAGWPEKNVSARVRELLEAVGLPYEEYGNRYPRHLSGGERQRVGIARALAADPPLLLLDEPFGALDPVTRLDLQRQFLLLRKRFGKTAIFVTHDVREALALATRIVLFRNGRIETAGTPDDFLRSQNAEARAFLACLDWKPEVW
jgi:osmoprotectant transport system ATP-binding protein